MAERLVASLLDICPEVTEVFVTRNIPESLCRTENIRVRYIDNPSPKGFGVNHNAAFEMSTQSFFCVLNPDVELIDNPFPELLRTFERSSTGLVAPMVKSPDGVVADSVRHYPSIRSLICRALGSDGDSYPLVKGQNDIFPDWIAGMFMLFRWHAFSELRGFDERFFLYYEDVDICIRAWRNGIPIAVCQHAEVIHHTQRDSHRKPTYLRWHLASMVRYFWKHLGRLPR